MKKSQVEKLIADTIDANTGATKLELMSIILHELERIGMKPPCCSDFGGHRTLNKFNECEDYIESCNFRWEPETKEENTK